MTDPDDIRRKAENLYRDFLLAWLNGEGDFFPREIRCRKSPHPDGLAATIRAVNELRDGSKAVRGFGYTVEWEERNSRALGRNSFPRRVLLESADDFLRLMGKQREFAAFRAAAGELRAAAPELESWIHANIRTLIDVAPHVSALLAVVRLFRANPRPDRFARELALPVDTKFIERHERVLRQWLDIVLPPSAIRADEEHFERRYGLRYAEPHVPLRLLDPQLLDELHFPCDELSLPLGALGKLNVRDVEVIIVENKVTLHTLPPRPRTIALGGLGDSVVALSAVTWLSKTPLIYWGDLDVPGIEILSSVRALFPQTRSVMMDVPTLEVMRHLILPGKGTQPNMPAHLTPAEQSAFVRCRSENLWLEQERLPPPFIAAALDRGGTRENSEATRCGI